MENFQCIKCMRVAQGELYWAPVMRIISKSIENIYTSPDDYEIVTEQQCPVCNTRYEIRQPIKIKEIVCAELK